MSAAESAVIAGVFGIFALVELVVLRKRWSFISREHSRYVFVGSVATFLLVAIIFSNEAVFWLGLVVAVFGYGVAAVTRRLAE